MKWLLFSSALMLATSALASGEKPVLPPMPASSPEKDEVEISGLNDPVSDKCMRYHLAMWKKLHLRIVRIVVTRSPQWGVIWRADTSLGRPSDDTLWRSVCWQDGILEEPLEFFDPKENIPRL